jgi:hypothetical protein
MKIAGAALAILALSSIAQAQEEWPGWRGPRRDGTSTEPRFPLRWSATEGVLWKVAVPGKGHSSPVVWGDRVYLTTCIEDKGERRLLCLDRKDGRTVWDQLVLTSPLEKKHKYNNYASSTPVTDGRHLWLAFFDNPKFRVFCYDMDGKLAWQKEPGEFHSVHGFCSSPLLYKDMVIFNGDQDALAWIVALAQATGEERWRADRPNRTRSYVPPVVFEAAGRPQLVLSGSKCVASYDPDTGKEIWIANGPTEQMVASLVFAEGVLFVAGGFPERHFWGMRPDGQGNVSGTHILWRHEDKKLVPYIPSPVAWGSWFFAVSEDTGKATCLEAKTGKIMWTEQLGKEHRPSPVAAAGHLYFADGLGATYVVKAAPEFELVAKNELKEPIYASPALSRGRIYIRTIESLYCIGGAER